MRGVRTRKQALADGHSAKAIREALRRKRWQRPFRGVYVMHSARITWRERMLAAVLAAGPGATASGECALVQWGLSTHEPSFLTVDIPAARSVRAKLPGVRVRRRRRLTRAEKKGIPVTGLHQTVLDVIALPRWTIDDIIILLAKACAPRRSSPAKLREELAHHPHHPRRALLDEVLAAAELGLESGAEWRYVTAVERPHGLPPMTPQAPLDGPTGTTSQASDAGPAAPSRPGSPTSANHPTAGPGSPTSARRHRRLDFLDEERDIGLEIDGELYHRENFRKDRTRDRKSAGQGRIILRACFVDVVVTPCDLAADVAAVQISRGWQGRPHPCSDSCPLATDPRLASTA